MKAVFLAVKNRLPLEFRVVVALAIAALGLFGFLSIAEEMMEQETHAFDEVILLALRSPGNLSDPLGPVWFESAVGDITALGGYAVLTLILTFTTIYLIAMGRWRNALLAVSAVVSGTILSSVLKLGFARPRPDLVEHLTHATSASFPSGHATLSAVAYLTLGLFLARAADKRRGKVIILSSAVSITTLVGVSRVYLGVHWPSDVLAGWCIGAAWASIWWVIAWYLAPPEQPEPVQKD
jgi:undecaprenyl-diphosphatase